MKQFKSLIPLILVLCLLTACASTAPATPAPASTPAAAASEVSAAAEATPETVSTAAGEAKTVTVVPWSTMPAEIYPKIEADFNSKHTDYKIKLDVQANLWNYILAKLASNDLPDVFYVAPHTKLKLLAEQGALLDMTGWDFNNLIYDSLKAGVTYEDRVIAYPSSIANYSIYYNVDLFEKAGVQPPKTLTELEAVCAKLKAAKITPFSVAFKDIWTMWQGMGQVYGNTLGDSTSMFSWLGSMGMDQGSWKTAGSDNFFRMMDIIKANCIPKPMDSDVNNMLTIFAKGEAAMYINGDWSFSTVLKANPDIKIGAFGYPASDDPASARLGVDSAACFAASSYTKVPEGVKAFIDYVANPEDTSGWTYNNAKEGFNTPPFPYTKVLPADLPAYQQFKVFMDAKQVNPCFKDMLPPNVTSAFQSELQGYCGGLVDRDKFVKDLDAAYKKNNAGN